MNQTEEDPERTSVSGRRHTVTRLLFASGFVLVFALLAIPARASELWRMNAFSTAITVEEDGTLFVKETIEAEFLKPRHGIFRYIPYKGRTTDGKKYRLDMHLLGVTDGAGVPQKVKKSRSHGNVVWRIGDPDRTLTGTKTYVIEYEVRDAILRLDERDELFWNVSGEGWDVPLPNLKVSVEFPELSEGDVEVRCFTGHYGSTAEDCFSIKAPSFAGATTENAGDPMTVSVSWPKGHIGTAPFIVRLTRWFSIYWHFSLPLLALAFYWSAWRRFGDDDTGFSVVPEYEAPKGLRPAQLKAILKQHSSSKDIAPTLIDLAVRGYLRIEEVNEKVWYGTRKDYLLKRLEKDGVGLEKYETALLDNIFSGKSEKKVSELENIFYRHLPDFKRSVMASLVDKGLFEERPNTTRLKWIAPGLGALGAVAFIVIRFGETFFVEAGFMVSLALATIVILGFGWAMPKWTREGMASVRHGKGFKLFISKVKKYRTAWEEKENIFEAVLPYALVFGLGKKWASAFAGLETRPPSWYAGTSASAWNPIAFESSLTSMMKTFTDTASSSPSSSGSSGGFSGGGFGGGGGGSW